MRIDDKTLKKIRVITASGVVLGKVSSFEIDTETHLIIRYTVKSSSPVRRAVFIINRAQVLQITDTKIVVDDAAVRRIARPRPPKMTPLPVEPISRQTN